MSSFSSISGLSDFLIYFLVKGYYKFSLRMGMVTPRCERSRGEIKTKKGVVRKHLKYCVCVCI